MFFQPSNKNTFSTSTPSFSIIPWWSQGKVSSIWYLLRAQNHRRLLEIPPKGGSSVIQRQWAWKKRGKGCCARNAAKHREEDASHLFPCSHLQALYRKCVGKCCEHFHSGIGSPLSMFKGAMALRSRSFELIWKSFFIYIYIYIYIHSRRILILYVLIILCNFRCRFSLVFWWASLLSNPISFFFIFPEKTSTVAEVVMGPMIESSRMSWSWFWEGIYFLSFPTGFWNMITRRKPNAVYI